MNWPSAIAFIALVLSTTYYAVDHKIPQHETNFTNIRIQAAHSIFNAIPYKNSADNYNVLWGYSMRPTYFAGNTALLKKYNRSYPLKEGEIIRYLPRDNQIVLDDQTDFATIHRVIAVYPTEVIVGGDNVDETERISYSQITDIVIGVLFT